MNTSLENGSIIHNNKRVEFILNDIKWKWYGYYAEVNQANQVDVILLNVKSFINKFSGHGKKVENWLI